jgi:hypothetical protein
MNRSRHAALDEMRQFDANVLRHPLTVYFLMTKAARSTHEKSTKLKRKSARKNAFSAAEDFHPWQKHDSVRQSDRPAPLRRADADATLDPMKDNPPDLRSIL